MARSVPSGTAASAARRIDREIGGPRRRGLEQDEVVVRQLELVARQLDLAAGRLELVEVDVDGDINRVEL